MRVTILIAAILVAASASASMIEDTLSPVGVTYQEDAQVHGDAPDTCETVDLSRTVSLGDGETFGMVVQEDDESDVYAMTVAPEQAGARVAISVTPQVGVEIYDLQFDVFNADCGFSVFDPEGPWYTAPPPAPESVFEAGEGQAEFSSPGNNDYSCNSSEWKILIKDSKDSWADSIYVEWTDGTEAYVPANHATPTNTANYLTSANLESTIKRIVVLQSSDWGGEIMIAHGPCDVEDGSFVAPPAPSFSGLYGEFTVVEPGLFIVQVSILKDAVEKTSGTAVGLVENPPTSIRADCHYTVCTIIAGQASYVVDGFFNSAA